MLLGVVFAFLLMAGYSLLKPIREEIGSANSDYLSYLWSGTFWVMLALVPLFGWASSRFPRRTLIIGTYQFFALNLVAFYLLLRGLPDSGTLRTVVDCSFYIWVSVFNLFAVSLFWSFLTDIFRSDQGKRLFPRIMMGATLGAVAGPWLTLFLIKPLGTANLMWVSILLIQGAVACFLALDRGQRELGLGSSKAKALGGGIWDGARTVWRSPYLRSMCIYLLLFLVSGGFLYRLKAQYARDFFEDREARTSFFATVDGVTNGLTLALQFLLTGKLLQRFGVGFTLAILPVLTMFAFGALGLWTSLAPIVAADMLRRVGNYALAKPAREVLYTVVPRDQKYKSKSFIDTFVYRGGDSAVSWMYDLFATFLQGSGLAFAVVPFAALWTGSAVRLGRQHKKLENESPPQS